MRKWVLILLIITAAVVWMDACGPTPGPEVVVVEPEPTETEQPAPEAPVPEQEVISVMVWATNDFEEEAFYAMVERFEEANPDVRVELTVHR